MERSLVSGLPHPKTFACCILSDWIIAPGLKLKGPRSLSRKIKSQNLGVPYVMPSYVHGALWKEPQPWKHYLTSCNDKRWGDVWFAFLLAYEVYSFDHFNMGHFKKSFRQLLVKLKGLSTIDGWVKEMWMFMFISFWGPHIRKPFFPVALQ